MVHVFLRACLFVAVQPPAYRKCKTQQGHDQTMVAEAIFVHWSIPDVVDLKSSSRSQQHSTESGKRIARQKCIKMLNYAELIVLV